MFKLGRKKEEGQKDKSLVWVGDCVDDTVVHRNFKHTGEAPQGAVRVRWGMDKIWGRTKGLIELQVL